MSEEIDFDMLRDDSIFLDVANANDTARSNSFLEDSFASCVAGQVSSTPIKAKPPSKSCPTQAKKDRLPCSKCSSTFASERTLGIHVKMHAMKGASSRIPKEAEIRSVASDFFDSVVKEIIKEEESSGEFPSLHSYCQTLLEDQLEEKRSKLLDFLVKTFHQSCGSQNALMPSALRSAMYVNTNHMLCSTSFREQCLQVFQDVLSADSQIINLFSSTTIFKLFEKFLAYVLKKMRDGGDSEDMFKRSSDNINSKDFQQVVYHVSGFIVHSFVRKGEALPSNSTWSVYVDVLKRKFLANPLYGDECSSQVKGFTENVSRGGLKNCSSDAFDFFLILFDFLMSLENSDGSLLLDVVDEKVSTHDSLLFWWDNLVSSDLTEEQSLDLFIQTVHSSARVVSKGIMKRRLNNELQKAYTSIPLRARLGRYLIHVLCQCYILMFFVLHGNFISSNIKQYNIS